MLLENYLLSSSTLPSKISTTYSKKYTKKKYVSYNEVSRLIIMKIKMKNRSHGNDITDAGLDMDIEIYKILKALLYDMY